MHLEIADEVFAEAVRAGVRDALVDGIRAEVKAFLEDYFGILTKEEAAAYLGCSERTIEALWQEHKLPKDTALGTKLPRVPFVELKEFAKSARIASRTQKGPRLRMVHPDAA